MKRPSLPPSSLLGDCPANVLGDDLGENHAGSMWLLGRPILVNETDFANLSRGYLADGHLHHLVLLIDLCGGLKKKTIFDF